MRYAIFSDVHGNLEALMAVLTEYKRELVDTFICLGDIVGYGADPSQCLSIIRKLRAITVAGNHDWAAAGLFSLVNFSVYAKESLSWTINQLNNQEKEFLSKLPLLFKDNNLTCVHSSLIMPDKFSYLVTQREITRFFNLFNMVRFE